MLARLADLIPKHPIGMVTDYRTVALLNYAVDPNVMKRLIPDPLEVDLEEGSGFVTVVCADMVRMRPTALPRLMGITDDQVVYRAPVRYRGELRVYPAGSARLDHVLVARGFPYRWFAAEVEQPNGRWQRPRWSFPA